MNNNHLLYTPAGIPLGEPMIGPDGEVGLKIKKNSVIEYVRLDYIINGTLKKLLNIKVETP